MNNFNALIESETPVLVDFHATWCGPCKMMGPILEEVSAKVKNKAKIIKVDVDKNLSAATAYKIMGVPTLILFKQGKIMWRQAGVVDAATLEKVIGQYAN